MGDSKKIVIFDLDGVLVDSIKIVNESLIYRYPTLTEEMLTEMLRGNFHQEMAKAKMVHKAIDETEVEENKRKANYTARKLEIPLYVGIHDLLLDLHEKGCILIINTSALEKNCLPLLEKVGILNLFDMVATAELSKSKVEKFKIIQKKYKVHGKNVLFITDTLGDLLEAKIAEIPTVAVTWGAHDKSYFDQKNNENLIGIVDSVSELQDIIAKYFNFNSKTEVLV